MCKYVLFKYYGGDIFLEKSYCRGKSGARREMAMGN